MNKSGILPRRHCARRERVVHRARARRLRVAGRADNGCSWMGRWRRSAQDQTSAGRTFLPQSDGPVIKSPVRFTWPAAGRVIVGFCWHPDERDDVINIAALPGTEVHAVASGRIAYAGDEVRGLHNLILISHRDGWVSAYADADERLVKRGDIVERGQVIARIDDGGRLRFELRR